MSSYVAIDFETANPFKGSICSVGMVRVEAGQIVKEWATLIRPPAGHDHFAGINVGVHGIRPADVVNAPSWPEVLPEIMRLAGGDPLAAHSAAGADVSMFIRACEATGLPVPEFDYVCTRVVAQRVWPELPAYKLPVVAAHLGIPLDHHNAASDARASALIVQAAMSEHRTTTVADLLRRSRIRMGTVRAGQASGCRAR